MTLCIRRFLFLFFPFFGPKTDSKGGIRRHKYIATTSFSRTMICLLDTILKKALLFPSPLAVPGIG